MKTQSFCTRVCETQCAKCAFHLIDFESQPMLAHFAKATLATEALSGRQPQFWLKSKAPAPKCNDKKLVNSESDKFLACPKDSGRVACAQRKQAWGIALILNVCWSSLCFAGLAWPNYTVTFILLLGRSARFMPMIVEMVWTATSSVWKQRPRHARQ